MTATPQTPSRPTGLTETDQAILANEARTWTDAGLKEKYIREELGMRPIRYYQRLNALLDDPRALAHAPVVVNRLRRLRGH